MKKVSSNEQSLVFLSKFIILYFCYGAWVMTKGRCGKVLSVFCCWHNKWVSAENLFPRRKGFHLFPVCPSKHVDDGNIFRGFLMGFMKENVRWAFAGNCVNGPLPVDAISNPWLTSERTWTFLTLYYLNKRKFLPVEEMDVWGKEYYEVSRTFNSRFFLEPSRYLINYGCQMIEFTLNQGYLYNWN